MVRVMAAPSPIRVGCAALFAVLLALRCLAPAGFMPAFDHGAVTIVACPDAEATPMMHHHPRDGSIAHQMCPYAASSVGAVGPDWSPLLLPLIFFAVALVLGRTFVFLERHSTRERPPAIGPPIPA